MAYSGGVPQLLAAISGQDLTSAVLTIIVVGLVFYLLVWLIGYIALPEPFSKIAKVILAVAAVFFLINVLLGLVGEPLVKWK